MSGKPGLTAAEHEGLARQLEDVRERLRQIAVTLMPAYSTHIGSYADRAGAIVDQLRARLEALYIAEQPGAPRSPYYWTVSRIDSRQLPEYNRNDGTDHD